MNLRFYCSIVCLFAATICGPSNCLAGMFPSYDHVVVAIFENHGYSQIIGSPAAPTINTMASQGALLTNSFGITHPSQPNYMHLYSGSSQGVNGNNPLGVKLNTPNLGASLLAAGKTFTGYYEAAIDVRHHPWTNWTNAVPGVNQLPLSTHQLFNTFPTDFNQLPTVSFVSPSDANNMHDGTIQTGDTWLSNNLGAYATWAKTHNSLLIVTFDEDNNLEGNRVATIFSGANVKNIQDATLYNHHNLLRTIEDIYDLSHSGNAANVLPMSLVFVAVPEPSSATIILGCLLVVFKARRNRKKSTR
ncbi:MAG: alkaline phosphatase family protein [Pirellula sp.]